MLTSRLASRAALLLALAGASTAAAQTQSDTTMVPRVRPRWTNGAFMLRAGSAHLGIGALNESFARNGRPQFASDVATVGFSGYARFGRLMLGGGGESALGSRIASPEWISKIGFSSATLDAGVVAVDASGMLIAPQLSLGVRRTSLRMERPGDFTYDEGVQNPARGVALSTSQGLIAMGIVVERHLRVRTSQLSIGVQAGVAQPFGGPKTYAGESQVHGTPRQATGRYLRFTIGKPLGGRRDVLGAVSGAVLSMIRG